MSDLSKEDQEKLDQLLLAIDRVYHSPKHIAGRSFLSGVFAGLGATVGVSLVLGLITYTLSQLQLFPIIGEFIKQLNIDQVVR